MYLEGNKMHAVVMEKKKRICAVLCDDGCFRQLSGDYAIGEEISVVIDNSKTCHVKGSRTSQKSIYKLLLPYVAAAVVIVVSGLAYTYEAVLAYSYVTVDVNPSIEYTLNRLNRVISVAALNEDAASIVDALDSSVKNKTLSDAISETVDILQENNYLLDADASMLVDVTTENEETLQDLSSKVSSALENKNINLCVLNSDKETRNAAIDTGMSTGRFEAMKNAAQNKTEEPQGTDTSDYAGVSSNLTAIYKSIPVKEIISVYEETIGDTSPATNSEIPEINTTEDKSLEPANEEITDIPGIEQNPNQNSNEYNNSQNSPAEEKDSPVNSPIQNSELPENVQGDVKEPMPQGTGSDSQHTIPDSQMNENPLTHN